MKKENEKRRIGKTGRDVKSCVSTMSFYNKNAGELLPAFQTLLALLRACSLNRILRSLIESGVISTYSSS
jgi:hypothetical protein